jgi:hypothetical protein
MIFQDISAIYASAGNALTPGSSKKEDWGEGDQFS